MQFVFQVIGKETSRRIGIETDVLFGGQRERQHTTHLLLGGIAARRDEDRLAQIPVLLLVQLVVRHSVIRTLKPVDMCGFRKGCPRRTGNPQTRTRIAPFSLALERAASVREWTSAFFQPYDFLRIFGQGHRESQIRIFQSVLPMLGGQTEMPVKGILRIEVDTAIFEVGVEFLL